jgi:hypothetical protein
MVRDVADERRGVASPSVVWVVVGSRGETMRVVGSWVGIDRGERRRRRWSGKGTVLMALVAEEADAICRESD